MTLTPRDIPSENLFWIGRGKALAGSYFHIAKPRKPFIFNRAEALNIIGYLVALDHWLPSDVDRAVNTEAPDPFRVSTDGSRFMITLPKSPVCLLTKDEAVSLVGHLIRKGGLRPTEIDAAVIAVEERGRGQTVADVVKEIKSS